MDFIKFDKAVQMFDLLHTFEKTAGKLFYEQNEGYDEDKLDRVQSEHATSKLAIQSAILQLLKVDHDEQMDIEKSLKDELHMGPDTFAHLNPTLKLKR
jgi:hypothetical protein